jgi:hypothetical protein
VYITHAAQKIKKKIEGTQSHREQGGLMNLLSEIRGILRQTAR